MIAPAPLSIIKKYRLHFTLGFFYFFFSFFFFTDNLEISILWLAQIQGNKPKVTIAYSTILYFHLIKDNAWSRRIDCIVHIGQKE